MIVPMKKATLLVLDRDRTEALKALRSLGVFHVERMDASTPLTVEIQARLSRIDQAIAALEERKGEVKKPSGKLLPRDEALSVADRVLIVRDEKKVAEDIIIQNSRELERLEGWGEVNPADFDWLADKGLYLFPFEMAEADYDALPSTINRIELSRAKKTVRCVLWAEDDLLHDGLPESARELLMPARPTKEIRHEIERERKALPLFDERLDADIPFLPSLRALKAEVLKELEFALVDAGMDTVSLEGDPALVRDSDLAWLRGYLPSDQLDSLAAEASRRGWGLMAEDPAEDDPVPTKLRNNPLVNLISPLLEFLGIVPGYRELDISLWFVIFFGIFFAMIFGDGGYGAILVLLSLVGIVMTGKGGKKAPTGLFMFLYLGLMTVAWGTVTCTWFGIEAAKLPGFFRNIALPAFSSADPDRAGENIKIFCFTLGLVQLSLAHVIGVVRNLKARSLKALGEVGSLAMTIGMYFVVLNLVVDAEKYPLTNVVLGMVGGGFALNFLFINYAGTVGGGILESLKNIITMFLGVVNVFGDIMSYIRLWAVGMAGSAISATVNAMAGPTLGGFLMLLGIVLLAFGHGLNYIMNVLSVIVHGVRLNTLEFSNHLGLTWSGFKYEPFAETANKQE